MTYHGFEVNVGYLVFRGQAEPFPIVLGDTLVILDDLLWVATVEDELDHRFICATFGAFGQLNKRIMYTRCEKG